MNREDGRKHAKLLKRIWQNVQLKFDLKYST